MCSSFRFNNRREYIEVLGLNCHRCGFIKKENLVGNSGSAPDFSEGGGTMRSCSKTCLTHQKLMKLCCSCRSDRAGHTSCQYSLKSQPWCVMKFTGNFLYFFICKEPDGLDDSGSFEFTLSLSPSLSAEHPRPQGPDHSRVVCPRRSLPGNVLQR